MESFVYFVRLLTYTGKRITINVDHIVSVTEVTQETPGHTYTDILLSNGDSVTVHGTYNATITAIDEALERI